MRKKYVRIVAVGAVAAAIVATSVASASAATSSLTVTTLGRNGAKVATTVNVVGLDGSRNYSVASGTKLVLPSGSYGVITDIYNPLDSTDTLGASVVSISGTKSLTIDARNGRAVSVRLDTSPGPDYSQMFQTRTCVGDVGLGAVNAWSPGGSLYVIANSSPQLHFAYMSTWENPDDTDAYVVSAETNGLPGSLNTVYHRASLATWNATVRRGPAGTPNVDLALQPETQNFSCQTELFQEIRPIDQGAPYSITTHVSPGIWLLRSDEFADVAGQNYDIGELDRQRQVTAGGRYSQTFYWAPWGPAHNLPYVWRGQLTFDSNDMFSDPSATGFECCEKTTATLSFGSKVISTQHLTNYAGEQNAIFSSKIMSTGWYTLNLSAIRSRPDLTYPADMLSGSSTVSFHFWGNPSKAGLVPVYLARFAPSGLDANNDAKPNSTTTVGITPDREALPDTPAPSVAVSSIKGWASFDGGTTWHAETVKHVGSSWSMAVTNPASGTVSLRATITNNSGVTTVTIPKAYAIG